MKDNNIVGDTLNRSGAKARGGTAEIRGKAASILDTTAFIANPCDERAAWHARCKSGKVVADFAQTYASDVALEGAAGD